jgi:glycosyltransferase involved in cell wall biosynthesis
MYNALAATVVTSREWSDYNAVFYSRDIFSTLSLLCFRHFIRGKIIYEAHTFPETRARFVVDQFRKLDGLVCITGQLKRLFVDAGFPRERLLVVHDAVDLEQFDISSDRYTCRVKLGLPQDRPIVGYVGRFHTMGMEKGIPDLVCAMEHLVKAFPDNPPLLMCVGGPMDSVQNYENISRAHGVPLEHLKFVDRVPNIQVPFWIKACDVVTIPWTWNRFSAYYTSPMKLFEYMASGVPIVASNLPSLREVLSDGKNALLCDPGNTEALAGTLCRALSNVEIGQVIAKQALVDVKQYTWRKRAKSILKFVT